MRYLLLTLLGFFGPALLMFLLRAVWFYLRQKWEEKKREPEIIDITPTKSKYPGKGMIAAWLLVSLLCTGLLIWQLDDTPAPEHIYIPAHIDAQGNFVPAQTIEKPRP